ncbi:S24 family peptidase [Paenalcaligenes suwonensis]|uniref:S24 family peptidase n=1 Tax=Paenalcaligenes suwonensis TaxID=1202713 RepID=UPI00140BD667|nr:helix-turn-helix transcriptional regulator [Paenalcaligenes suwonensis]NHC62202.1 helix-turn-helix transcriptional regulator [Paenalcaligenes suwonensis]
MLFRNYSSQLLAYISTMVDYSERLVWAMKRAGADERWLSGRLGVSYQAVKKVVDGKSSALNAANNSFAARLLGVNSDWLATGDGEPESEPSNEVIPVTRNLPIPSGYVRLEHLSPQPSMGNGMLSSEAVQVVQHLDVLERWARAELGTTNPERVKIMTGVGRSMQPTIHHEDLVFVDVSLREIDREGLYVLDVAGRFILKRARILASGTLIISSDNKDEYPDEERYDLRTASDTIIVCAKVLAWWTLRKG